MTLNDDAGPCPWPADNPGDACEVEPRGARGFQDSGWQRRTLPCPPTEHAPAPVPGCAEELSLGSTRVNNGCSTSWRGSLLGFAQSDVRSRLVWTKIGRFKARTNAPSIDAGQHG